MMNDMSYLPAKITDEKRAEFLAYHEKMSRLFRENRFLFELERKTALEKIINSADTRERKKRLTDLQEKWDTTVRHAGSGHNRMVLAEMMLWDFVRDVWRPTLERGR